MRNEDRYVITVTGAQNDVIGNKEAERLVESARLAVDTYATKGKVIVVYVAKDEFPFAPTAVKHMEELKAADIEYGILRAFKKINPRMHVDDLVHRYYEPVFNITKSKTYFLYV